MYDAAIIGGGPAGSTAATVLAREGFRAVVIDKDRFPRYHIGESLLPRTLGIYKRLGLEDALNGEGFVRKVGAHIVTTDGALEREFDFTPRRPGDDRQAWEVERDVFDHLLAKNAVSAGAEFREGTSVLEVEGEGPCRLRLADDSGTESTVEARWVFDASGQNSILAKKHGLRVTHDEHKRVAFYARYRGMTRRDGDQAGNIDLVLCREGWFWLIPLRDDVASVGYVMKTSDWKASGLDGPACLERAIQASPFVSKRLSGATRLDDVTTAGNYSYFVRNLRGPGFVLVGDAAGFLDPIFSTGVMLAMRTAEVAALALVRTLRSGRAVTPSTFTDYERTVRRWMRVHFEMIQAFYRPGFAAVLLNPRNTFGVVDAVTTLLAGRTDLSLGDRLRLKLFYAIVRLNNALHFIPDPFPVEMAVTHA